MAAIWASVVAALGASLLTGFFGFGLEWWRLRKAAKEALAERRFRAYTALLVQSASIMHLASDLHLTMELRSGLREGVNVTVGKMKPLDPLEFTRWVRTELQPMYEAWSEVWAIGSREAIAEANDLLAKCAAVMGAATQRGQGRPALLQMIAGVKWSQDQLDQWQEEMRGVAAARKRFGAIARKETGVEDVDLFASNELGKPGTEEPPSADSPAADEKPH